MKKVSLLCKYVLVMILALFCIAPEVYANSSGFSDVPKDHYAVQAIKWANANGIASGYGDGRFGPNDAMTEQQFAKMIVNFFELREAKSRLMPEKSVVSWNGEKTYSEAEINAGWAAEYYNRLASYGVPLNGYLLPPLRTNAMKRGTVAQTLTYLLDGRKELSESIEYLHNKGITTWQQPAEYTVPNKFGYLNNLTRAQVVTFLYRLHGKSMNRIHTDAQSLYDLYNPEIEELYELALDGKYVIDPRLQKASGVETFKYDARRPPYDHEEIERKEIVKSFQYARLPIDEEYTKSLKLAKLIEISPINYFADKLSDRTKKLLDGYGFTVQLATSMPVIKNGGHIILRNKEKDLMSMAFYNNDFAPDFYGKRKYTVSGPFEMTEKVREVYASVISDLGRMKISGADMKKYQDWGAKRINTTDDYGFQGQFGNKGQTYKVGKQIYISGDQTFIFIDKTAK